MSALAGDFDYEAHGQGYAQKRRTDPRIAAIIDAAIGSARTVLNIGAGSGSYEPDDRAVTAVEPSAAMRAQRPPHRVPAIIAAAESLPFDDGAFDAAMAVMTVHQWAKLDRGLAEMRRVARGSVVILTVDPEALRGFWLADYAPEKIILAKQRMPAIDDLVTALGSGTEVRAVPVFADCADGFAQAYFARPERLLEPAVRGADSDWRLIGAEAERRAVQQLRTDLESGAWDARHGALRTQRTFDGGLRLVVGNPHAAGPFKVGAPLMRVLMIPLYRLGTQHPFRRSADSRRPRDVVVHRRPEGNPLRGELLQVWRAASWSWRCPASGSGCGTRRPSAAVDKGPGRRPEAAHRPVDLSL